MKKCTLIGLILFLNFSLCAQYISEVIEYTPAPGQFINASPWGTPNYSTNSIVGNINGSLSLGAFGGYVIFKFATPVENNPNNPFGVDFTIFGNPLNIWSEPGVVYVMKDENQNGVPDDTWHELAGSDYYFSSTIKNYQATYYNPNSSVATDVPWIDNYGNSDFIYANSYHTQPYYPLSDSFPHINQEQYLLSGTRLENLVDQSNPMMISCPRRSFGYADNQLRGSAPYTVPDNPYTREKENSGGDAFDISWAIDANGNYVDLDEIDFVKIQTAILADAGWSGEVSTEITGAVKVEPNSSITGVLDMIVIRDLPKTIHEPYQLEVFVFHQGRLIQDAEIQWESSLNGVHIDENNLLTFTEYGAVDLTCSLVENTEIKATVSTTITYPNSISELTSRVNIFPNPTNGYFSISLESESSIEIFNLLGQSLFTLENVSNNQTIDISSFVSGTYLIKITTKTSTPIYRKVIKK